MRAYAGVGSRKTPEHVLAAMRNLGRRFAELGYMLRSGAAKGADTAFEEGCDAANGTKQIFLPYKNFMGHPSELYKVSEDAIEMGMYYDPFQGRGTIRRRLRLAEIAIRCLAPISMIHPTLLCAGLEMVAQLVVQVRLYASPLIEIFQYLIFSFPLSPSKLVIFSDVWY